MCLTRDDVLKGHTHATSGEVISTGKLPHITREDKSGDPIVVSENHSPAGAGIIQPLGSQPSVKPAFYLSVDTGRPTTSEGGQYLMKEGHMTWDKLLGKNLSNIRNGDRQRQPLTKSPTAVYSEHLLVKMV